jgi:hypothetical protein
MMDGFNLAKHVGFPWFSMVFLNMALKRCRKNSHLNVTMTINSRLVGKSGPTMSHRLSQHCLLPRFQCTWMVSTRLNSLFLRIVVCQKKPKQTSPLATEMTSLLQKHEFHESRCNMLFGSFRYLWICNTKWVLFPQLSFAANRK